MLSSGPLWGTLTASLIVGASCSNDFVRSKFPSEFGQDKETEYYWDNLKGYIAGIRVVSAAQDDSDDNWILGRSHLYHPPNTFRSPCLEGPLKLTSSLTSTKLLR